MAQTVLANIYSFDLYAARRAELAKAYSGLLTSGILRAAGEEFSKFVRVTEELTINSYKEIARLQNASTTAAQRYREGTTLTPLSSSNVSEYVVAFNRGTGFGYNDFARYASRGEIATIAPLVMFENEIQDREDTLLAFLLSFIDSQASGKAAEGLTKKYAVDNVAAGSAVTFTEQKLIEAIYEILDEKIDNRARTLLVPFKIMEALRVSKLMTDYRDDLGTGLTVGTWNGLKVLALKGLTYTGDESAPAEGDGREIGRIFVINEGAIESASMPMTSDANDLACQFAVYGQNPVKNELYQKWRYGYAIPGTSWDLANVVDTDDVGTEGTIQSGRDLTPTIDNLRAATWTKTIIDNRDLGIAQVLFNI